MLAVDHLNAMRIQKRFDGLRETHSVLPDILDFFFKIPFEFHCAEHTTVAATVPDERRRKRYIALQSIARDVPLAQALPILFTSR